MLTAAILSAAATLVAGVNDDVSPHGGMLQFPDVSATHIAFVYGNDIWMVPREGGTAVPLASPPGQEASPKFSPDGKSVAFVGNYDGDRDLYTLPVDGGLPVRVSHHPANETLCDWTPDGDGLLFFQSGLSGMGRMPELYTVGRTGGMPDKLPPAYGTNGALSPDGKWLAFTPFSRDNRTWKRYRGGMASDIWLMDLDTLDARQITTWEGTDTLPMWSGSTVYYLSDDGASHRLNIWAYDVDTDQREQITNFTEFDVKWPSMGPGPRGRGEIVFQNGPDLYLLDLANRQTTTVDVQVPGARPKLRPVTVDASDFLQNWAVSPNGKRVLVEARGDIWTVPVENGSPRNLTDSDGAADRDPVWSPDGRWVAYFSDQNGEYELYITQSDGKGETRRLTSGNENYFFSPTWSPDSELIAFTDRAGTVFLHDIEDNATTTVDKDPWASRPSVSFSHDSSWIAYGKSENENAVTGAVWLYNIEDGRSHKVTSGMFNDRAPAFDRKGEFLYYVSAREFNSPSYEDAGSTFIYDELDRVMMVPLRDDVESPFAAKSDEESWNDDADKDEDAEDDDAKDENGDDEEDKADEEDKEEEPLEIELVGFEERAMILPVDRGNFFGAMVNDKGHVLYARRADRGFDLQVFDASADEPEEKTVASGLNGASMTADGSKVLVRKGGSFHLIDTKPDQKLKDAVSMAGMSKTINPRDEWKQVFTDAWRRQRDFFYDPNMHGVDWDTVHDQYAAMLDDCTSREDVSYVIREMISELNVGHAYYRSGPSNEDEPRVAVGLLGCDFELDERGEDPAYRITKILHGAPWDADARSPLLAHGVDVNEGDYLLAVNGVPLDTDQDPWASFIGLAGRTVVLTVSDRPFIDDDAREVVVETIGNESALRYRDWVETNRALVDARTSGRVGYIHVPDTGQNGQNELFRQFYGQAHKDALIIDERWNGGGQIPTRFIELLNRPRTNYWSRRHGNDWPWPYDSHQGPKCMLINGMSGSGGDMFPFLFKQAELGKLIGERTWGGLVGISGKPGLIDGAGVTVPDFAFYEKDGTWGIEGHGVDPDIRVVADPGLLAKGIDPQLEAAIELMNEQVERSPYVRPPHPSYPNRSGMGLADDDR